MAELKSYRPSSNYRDGAVTPSDPVLQIEENGASVAIRNGKPPDKPTGSKDGKEKEKKEPAQMVGFFEIFKFATAADVLFMILGSLSSMCHGSAFPLMIIVFGRMIDIFVSDGIMRELFNDLSATNFFALTNKTMQYFMEDPTRLDRHNTLIMNLTGNKWDVEEMKNTLNSQLLETMQTYAIYFIGIGCGVIVLGYGQVMFWMIASERQTHRIRKQFYEQVLRQNIGWFDTNESGELNSRLTNDISKIHDGIGDKLGQFLQWFCAFLAGFTVGFIYSWKLTLVILAISPLLAGSAFIMTKLVGLASALELKAYARAGAVAEEVLGSIRTVVAFGGEEKESQRYDSNLVEARTLGVRKGLINGASMGIVWLVIFGAYALGFWYGAKLAREESDTHSIGDVMIVFFSVLIGAFSLGHAGPSVQSFAEARGAAFSVYRLIELIPPIDSADPNGQKLNLQGNIQLQNVHFNYPSRPDVKVLRGVSLRVSRGQTVALVGASGCGKSTIVQLIQRFYDPDQGQLLIDGVDVKDINLKWLREQIGIVSQEPVLFGTSIAENIRYGRLDVTKEQIEQASRMANAHDFIKSLPNQYETLVGERGAQLSGGQKQRVAIARALVRDPKILLLDEATSALDTESEGVVQEALEKASHGRTTIVIAHRLSTIKTADVIAGFKDGLIVEQGTHDELMAKNGIYYQLVTQQSMTTEEDEEAERYGTPALLAQKSVEGTPLKRALSADSKPEEKKEKEETVDAGMKRIMSLNSPEWYLILIGCFASLFNGGLMPAFAVIFAEIIGVFAEVDAEVQERKILEYCLMFVGIGVFSFFTHLVQGYMFGRSGEYLTLRLRSMSFKAMLRQDMAFFDDHDNNVGALTTRLSTDSSQVQGVAGIRLGTTMMALCSVIAGLVIGFIYSWQLTLLILAFLPILMVGGALQLKMLQGAAGKNKEALEAAGKVAIESIENMRTVASLTREQMFFKRFQQELESPYRQALRKAHIVGITFSISQGVIFFAYAASFWLGAYLIENGDLDFVAVFKAFSAVVFGGMAVGQASSFAPDAGKAQKSAEAVFRLFDRVPAIDTESQSPDLVTPDSSVSSRVTFNNVKFRYPTRPNVPVLTGLNLTVEPGQTVALVGSSGCGKSTTVQLTERFYDPQEGSVCMDRYDLTKLNLKWLRSQVGIVSQEPVLFDRSIGENIAYGDNSRQVDMSEIISAARNANIHEFIASLPEGYDTNVGEKGAQLSGGQKQRVAIARALVRNPRILLLDEATSALDTESEKVVQEALDKAREGRTSIVIAHRLSTVQNADKICVIRHGTVTEEGKHGELMKKQGFYYKLNMIQARKK